MEETLQLLQDLRSPGQSDGGEVSDFKIWIAFRKSRTESLRGKKAKGSADRTIAISTPGREGSYTDIVLWIQID